LGFTVRFRDEATTGTSTGCIARVGQLYQHPRKLSLILDKLNKLAESPGVVATPLGFSNRCPIPDAVEVFQGNQAMGVFSLRHQLLADYVVGVSSEVSFPTRKPFKMSLSRFSSLALERSLKPIGLFPYLVYFFTRIKLPIAVNGKVDNSQVNSQCSNGVIWGGFWGINRNRKIEGLIAENKVTLFDNPVKPYFLISPNPDGDKETSLKCEDGDSVQSLPGEDALIINHRRMELEGMQSGLISAIAFNHFSNNSDCHLSRQAVVLTKIAVSKVVELYLAGCMLFKGKPGDIVTRLIKSLHRLKKSVVLLGSRAKFDHQSLFHSFSIEQTNPFVKGKEVWAASSAT